MKKRFKVLDIFRGLFASFVFLFHLSPFADTPVLDNGFTRNADMFVDFFFVLSGFVIANGYEGLRDMGGFRRFYRKRFFRIYPLHIIVLLLFLLVEAAKHLLAERVHVNNLDNPANSAVSFLSNVLLLHSTPVFGIKDVSWNIASWSISAEMIAYLLFGLVAVAIHKSGLFRSRAVVYTVILLAATAVLVMLTGGYGLNYTFNYGFLRGIIGFFAGVICFGVYQTGFARTERLKTVYFSIAELLILAITAACICSGERMKQMGLLYVPLYFCSIYIFSFEKGIVSKWLLRPALLHELGAYSYSIYMLHVLFISLFNVLFIRVLHFPPSSYVWLVVPNFLAIFYASRWSYRHIEMRFSASPPRET
jgi:peptidoglycan/LPS O-acetylase OafA/YrhL